MHCRNCGKQINDKAHVCIHCGFLPKREKNFCHNCGEAIQANQAVCLKCGVSFGDQSGDESKNKITAGLLALLLGCFGAHKFYLGFMNEAIVVLIVSIVGLIFAGIPTFIMFAITMAEGIIYLTKSDDVFQQTYVTAKKRWF